MTKRQYLLKTDKPDSRDLLFSSIKAAAGLPEQVDLRKNDPTAIFDQGSLGSCTANALCAMLSYLDKNFTYPSGLHFEYSRLFLYWQERKLEGTIGFDSGAYLRDGMKVLKEIGCAGESTFPYVEHKFTFSPSQEANDAAAFHKINEYRRLNSNDPTQLKESLAAGYPVAMGIEIYSSFESDEVARTGILPMPDRSKEYLLGGHALLAMGYKTNEDGTGYIIARNSWGPEWGDKGYCYIPMDFIGRYVPDLWVAK